MHRSTPFLKMLSDCFSVTKLNAPFLNIATHKKMKAITCGTVLAGFLFGLKKWNDYQNGKSSPHPKDKKPKGAVLNYVFLARLMRILKIVIPTHRSVEALYLAIFSILMFTRTVVSIKIAEIMGVNGQCLIDANLKKFLKALFALTMAIFPASIISALFKYLNNILAINFRRNLTMHIHEKYLSGIGFYKINSSLKMDNIDRRITQDVEQMASGLLDLYSMIFKPLVDILLFTPTLASSVGVQGPALIYFYYIFSSVVAKCFLPNLAGLLSKKQKLEGDYGYRHTVVIMHAEEIAFYRGWDHEKFLINESFDKLYGHCRELLYKQALVGVLDAWFVKYGATLVRYLVVALSVFTPIFNSSSNSPDDSSAKRYGQNNRDDSLAKRYVQNSQVLISLAKATGQLLLVYKYLHQIFGHTSRITCLLEMLDEIKKNPTNNPIECKSRIHLVNVNINTADNGKHPIIKNLNLLVEPNSHTLIMGHNGVGKSSVFRVLRGIWNQNSGIVIRPNLNDIFFIPQRAYFPIGSLKEQVIYPDGVSQFISKGYSDEDLIKILTDCDLQYIIKREGGLDAVKDWADMLSGGEKQKLNFSRAFYHRPRFLCLDECTSAISSEFEGRLYLKCKELGITMVSIAHKKELQKYHQFLLEI